MDLNTVRKKLVDALGEDNKKYFLNMKMWFSQKMTKEDFDVECRKFLRPEQINLHNHFLLAMLNKCHSLTSSSAASKETPNQNSSALKDKLKKDKLKKKAKLVRPTFERRFQPVNPLPTCPQVIPHDPVEMSGPVLCVRDGTLPDIGMVHGRMYVTAWDQGLDGVEDDAVQIMMIAVEHILKAVLTAMFSRRQPYKLREKRFAYGSGIPVPNPYTRNTYNLWDTTVHGSATSVTSSGDLVPSIKPTTDWAEQEALYSLACSDASPKILPPVSLWDLYEALQVNRSVLSSHSVYAVNMERILSRLWHPSHEELEQVDINRQSAVLLEQVPTDTFYQ